MAIAFTFPRAQALDANGAISPGALLYFYQPGTLLSKDVYADADLTTVLSQPVQADAGGLFPAVFCATGTCDVVLTDQNSALIWDAQDFDPGPSTGAGAIPIASGGTGATTAAAARTNLGVASSSDVSALSADVSEIQTQIAGSLTGGGTRLGTIAGRDTIRAVDLDDTDFGAIFAKSPTIITLQSAISTASNIPSDTTKPQSGEGAEFWTATYTPKSVSSRILIRCNAFIGNNGQNLTIALFDGSADALAAVVSYGVAGSMNTVTLEHQIASWGTAAKTLSLRYGASSGTAYINQSSAGITQGGAATTTISVFEILGGPF